MSCTTAIKNHARNCVKGKKQYVWLARYPTTEHALVEGVGPYDSDIDPTIGIIHANAIMKRISSSGDAVPLFVYTDPFLRCTHTGDIIVKGLGKGNEKIHRIEEGLTEWQVASLLVDEHSNKTCPRTPEHLQQLFPKNIDLSYESVNPLMPDGTTRDQVPKGSTIFPETETDLFERCSTSITRILDGLKNNENVCIVSHAPCNIAMASFLDGNTDRIWKWSLGGLTRFSRTFENDGAPEQWNLDFYDCTEHMPRDSSKEAWSMPSFNHSKITNP